MPAICQLSAKLCLWTAHIWEGHHILAMELLKRNRKFKFWHESRLTSLIEGNGSLGFHSGC